MQYEFVLFWRDLSFINYLGRMIARIQQLKDHFGLSTRAFALKCGMNQPTLDRMLKGINALNLNCVSSILQSFPDVSAEWLMRGVGPMLHSLATNPEGERLNTLVDTIATLQDTINAKNDAIATLSNRVMQLENQLGK